MGRIRPDGSNGCFKLLFTPSSASSKNSLATLERKVEHCYEVLEKKYHNAEEIFQGVVSKNRQLGKMASLFILIFNDRRRQQVKVPRRV
jgi:hypothetical protein